MTDEDPISRPTRVAVSTLQHDQHRVLFEGDERREPPIPPLEDGFDSRRQFINWWQAASVRTLGHLSKAVPASVTVSAKSLITALCTDDPDDAQEWLRTRLIEKTQEACQVAQNDLEKRSTEWLSGVDDDSMDWLGIDAGEQAFVAMRPAYSEVDSGQAACLRRLWRGFDDREAIVAWANKLSTIASFDEVLDDPLVRYIIRDAHGRRMLKADTEEGQRYRERFAATKLLPAFATKVRRVRASELPRHRRGDDHEVPSL